MVVRVYSRSILGITLYVVLLLIVKQAGAQTDSFYIKSYYRNLVPRIVSNHKTLFTGFETKNNGKYSSDYFSTGSQSFVGIDLNYKWMSLGYQFAFNRENSSTNTDLRFSTSYKNLHLQLNYTDLHNLNYYRVNGKQQQDTVFMTKQYGITLNNAGFKADYVFNARKFHYYTSSAQYGRQLNNQGSLILTTGVSFQNFDLRNLSDQPGLKFTDLYKANSMKTLKIDAGLGYAYNWVIKKKLVISVSEIPNIGLQEITTSKNGVGSASHSAASFTNHIRMDIIYSWDNFFLGCYGYNTITTGRIMDYNYTNSYTNFQLYLGMLFNDPKKYLKMKNKPPQ
jgi:hypothetical protein